MLRPHGFEYEQDILEMTVNRWPHGYSYSYNSLSDSHKWAHTTTDDSACVVGRQKVGRVSIATADAYANFHIDAAINEEYRAVEELWP